jgi:signal peptidase II
MFDPRGKPPGPLSRLGLRVIIAVVALDQLTKLLADQLLPMGARIILLPILSLYRTNNTGIALSFLADSGGMLVALMIAVMVVIIVMWVRSADGGQAATVGFGLILGGAIGNLTDRLRLGHVIDFLFLHLGARPLFVFNVADVALTMGPALLLVLFLWPGKKPPAD